MVRSKVRHTRLRRHTVCFYLYDTLEKTNLMDSDRKWDSGCIGLGLGETGDGHKKVSDSQSVYLFCCTNMYQYSLSKHFLSSKVEEKLLMRI